jgi:SAM-dependent methyltransferase
MTNLQESAYPEDFDYAPGSPHLKHRALRARVDRSLTLEVEAIRAMGGRCRTLEIGAGHGSFTTVLRNAGADVTVTEMSGPSAGHLARKFSGDPSVRVIHDPDGTWVNETADRFDLVVAISVLHHIPDYLAAIARYAEITDTEGSFISWQDPMWYSRLSRGPRTASQAAYFAWRLGQGNLQRGLKTRIRRARGLLDEKEVSDMSEYHVVRQGVDEEAVAAVLRSGYSRVTVTPYWSTQSRVMQGIGEDLGIATTFSVVAQDRSVPTPSR